MIAPVTCGVEDFVLLDERTASRLPNVTSCIDKGGIAPGLAGCGKTGVLSDTPVAIRSITAARRN